jgi:hypothetical protein
MGFNSGFKVLSRHCQICCHVNGRRCTYGRSFMKMCEVCLPINIILEKLELRETLTNECVYYDNCDIGIIKTRSAELTILTV